MLLPSALGSSPHPPVSVYGTGTAYSIAAFLDAGYSFFATLFSLRFTPPDWQWDFPHCLLLRLRRAFLSRLMPPQRVPAFLICCGTGISTCCPSATHLCLALGPDLPMADQLYHGNLGYSAERILTFLSLLIPAFSLLIPPLLLPVQLL